MSEPFVTATADADVATVVERLTALLRQREITLFATIDHAAGARGVGLELPDETVLVFGNPKAGTPLMQQDARVGVELPLRLLVWDDGGTTRTGYLDPVRLAQDYEVAAGIETLHGMRRLLAELVAEASQASQPA